MSSPIRLGKETGTSLTLATYYLNSNHIFVINVIFMVVVEKNLKDS
jgi:hypothetical protein